MNHLAAWVPLQYHSVLVIIKRFIMRVIPIWDIHGTYDMPP
jgi:hypothetical protein